MGEELNVLNSDNIWSDEDIANFWNTEEDTEDSAAEDSKTDNKTTENTDIDSTSESVGSDEDSTSQEDTIDDNENASPLNFYSTIAKALKEDGVTPDLEDSTIDNIKSPEDFAKAIETQIQARFDERQKRIDAALNAGMETDIIRGYESTIDYLNKIDNNLIDEESDKSEDIRRRLIYQDYINRGYNQEQALKKTQKSFDNGTDSEDAKDALESNKEFFENKYKEAINEAQKQKEAEAQEVKDTTEKLKKSILEDSKIFGDLSIDKPTRQRAFDAISKPIYKDKETGELFTALQKYQKENRLDYLKNMGIIFTLTDGFKNFDKIINSKVNKEVNKSIKSLEKSLSNSTRVSGGNLKYASGVSDDESFILNGFKLDI